MSTLLLWSSIGRVDVKQQFVNLGIDLHCLTTLSILSARTRIPQIRGTRQLAGELRHRIVKSNAPHDGCLAMFVYATFLQIQQHLEFLPKQS